MPHKDSSVNAEDFGFDDEHEGTNYGDEAEHEHGHHGEDSIDDWENGAGEDYSEEEEGSGNEWGDEGEGEEEYPEGEGEEYSEEEGGEAASQDEEKKPWKKYGIIGAAVVLLGGAATWVMGGHSNNQATPQVAASHVKAPVKSPFATPNANTAQNTANGFPAVQKPVVAPGAQVTPPVQTPSLPNQQASNGFNPAPVGLPNAGQNGFQNGGFPPPSPEQGNFRPGMNHPVMNGGVYDNGQELSPYQRHQIENDASGTLSRTIALMGKSLHEDIHKTSDDEKALINKRIDDLQALIMKRLDAISSNAPSNGSGYNAPAPAPAPAPAVSEASRDQIEGIRDTLSAMRMTLESANTTQKGQQDTIAALRSEIETLRNQDNTPHSYARPAPVRHKAPVHHADDASTSTDAPPPAPVKKISAGWKLRGYNSSNNTVVLQSPKGDYYEESIGYLAKDDGGKDLGVGKLNAIEKQDSGSYVLHTSLGDIQQGH